MPRQLPPICANAHTSKFRFALYDVRQQAERPKPFCETTHSRTFLVWRSDWWSQTGSNRRPHACKARALPTELWPLKSEAQMMVGLGGLEPPTSRLSSARSNQLSYKPLSSLFSATQKPEPLQGSHSSSACIADRLASSRSARLPLIVSGGRTARERFKTTSANQSFTKKEKRRRRMPAMYARHQTDCPTSLF